MHELSNKLTTWLYCHIPWRWDPLFLQWYDSLCTFWRKISQQKPSPQKSRFSYFNIQKRSHTLVELSSSHTWPYHKICHVLCFRIRTGTLFYYSPRDGINEKNSWVNKVATARITHTDRNSTAAGVVKITISPRKIKTMDGRLQWIRCRETQGKFWYNWASGSLNWGDYSTKHHPTYITNRKEWKLQEF